MPVRALKLQPTEGQTLVGASEALVTQKWVSHVVNGQLALPTPVLLEWRDLRSVALRGGDPRYSFAGLVRRAFFGLADAFAGSFLKNLRENRTTPSPSPVAGFLDRNWVPSP